ncbi:uncharacterized protein V6R79_011530 [Siganus canaliculatus]
MAKSSSRKTLKSLFSKSDASLDTRPEKEVDKNEGDKKRFKFFKLKSKSKNDSSSEKPANESQQVLSVVEPSNSAEDTEAWTENVVTRKKRFTFYGTAPRSKEKELSYSELDLRKPKKFATFSFGLRKKRKKDDETISKSTFGLDSSGLKEQEETPLDLSQMELSNTKKFSMSQPELDSPNKFKIPSPPPLATNQSESYFALINQPQSTVAKITETETIKPLMTSSYNLSDELQASPKAPIATIPELTLDFPASSEEKENIPVPYEPNSNFSLSHTETSSAVDQTGPDLRSQPLAVSSTSDDKAAVVESVPARSRSSSKRVDDEVLQQTSVPESTSSHLQPESAESKTPNSETSSVDTKMEATAVESDPVLSTVFASVTAKVSETEQPVPQTEERVTADVRRKKSIDPVRQEEVYGALYESLFPQSFTSEVMSSISHSPPKTQHTEIKRLSTKPDPVMVKTLNECHTETNVTYSRLSGDSHEDRKTDAESSFSNIKADFSERKMTPSSGSLRSTSYQSSTVSEPSRYLPSSVVSGDEPADRSSSPYSELTHSPLEVNSDRFILSPDITRSAPVLQNPAPPVHDYVTSHGTDTHVTQVTGSTKRVILVKESVIDEATVDTGCSSAPVLDKMSQTKILEIKTEPAAPGQTDWHDGLISPTYLSVGSDDGSAMEIYYSAEEDNGDEEMRTMDDREEMRTVDGVFEELPQQGVVAEGGVRCRVDKGETEEDAASPAEVQQYVQCVHSEAEMEEIRASELVVGSDGKSEEREIAASVFPQVKVDWQEERKEELPATPVQQVNAPMVCEFAPPSSEQRGQGEEPDGNRSEDMEREDHQDEESHNETQYLAHKGVRSSEYLKAATGETGAQDQITPTYRESEERVSQCADEYESVELSQGNPASSSNGPINAVPEARSGAEVVTGGLTHNTEQHSDATTSEHNAPSSEWVDTITQNAEGSTKVPQQVTVELSALNPDAQRALAEEKPEHPAEARTDPHQRSVTSPETLTTASENQPLKAAPELDDNMNSGYSSLSTTLSKKNLSPCIEDESKPRFLKVSLIKEVDLTEAITNTFVTDLNGSDPDSEYRWKNRYEGVSQYKSYTPEESYSSSSALPETTTCKYVSDVSSYSSSSSPSSTGEHFTFGNRLNDRTDIHLSRVGESAGERKDEWRRGFLEQEEPAAPVGETVRQREGESVRIKTRWDSAQLPASGLLSDKQTSYDLTDAFREDSTDRFTGVFQATLVELVSDPPAPLSTPPASPDSDSHQFDMDTLVDTLKNMGPSLRPRNIGLRAPPPTLVSSLPPIVEDAPSPITADVPDSVNGPAIKMEVTSKPAEPLNGLYTLPADLGLKWNSPRDTRSPLELMKQSQQDQQPGARGLNLPLRASATNSIVMRKSSDSSPEEAQHQGLNGNGLFPSPTTSSRLDNSVIFGGQRSASIDQTLESRQAHRPLFRTGSLPDTGLSNDRLNGGVKEPDLGSDPSSSRYERFSFLLSTSSSTSGSLTGTDDSNTRMSRPPKLSISSPPASNSPTRLLSPTGSIDLHRSFTPTDSPLSVGMGASTGGMITPLLQRSFSSEGTIGVQQTLFNNVSGGSQFQSPEREPERNLAVKYRAFPDAYLTKEKEHGKLNPRPGKMYIFDRPGMCGQRIEVRSDVIDATPWELQETISIRVIRGGWVLYEKPNFKGEKIALDEGDIELTNPFNPPEEQLQNGEAEVKEQNGETSEPKPAKKFIIGSIRRAVRDYSVPEISLFPEENAEGKKVIFRDTSEDARIFGFPIKANSIIINAGLWLVYAHPFFQGIPRVLEVGGYSNPAAWGVEKPYVGSLHPLKVGEPRVENTNEPKMVIYEKPYFSGRSRTITATTRDFMTRTDPQQMAFMYNVGSLKVLGGIWVGYEKEGFRGHQYLLEEGEYHDWRVWGGCDSELRSVRVIRADLTDPVMVMFEQLEEEQDDAQEENTFEVTEAIPDVELFGYKTSTRSIHVLSGAWIAYSHVDFSGNQYILEKGFYNNSADWGSQDSRICSVQPILLAPSDSSKTRHEIILYSEPDFHGECHFFDRNQEALSEKLLTKSCRVSGGSWVLYEDKQYSGNLYVLSEGDYPNLTSMGCPPGVNIRSVKAVPSTFSVPSISLFGLECLEGREITTETEIVNMVEEGFNNHILSVRVNSGCWVLCEFSNYRGRQFLLEPIEITNWLKFSSLQTIGSMFPLRQKRHFFRIKNKERGHVMSVQGGVEEMKSGRVVVSPEVEPMSDIWFYQDGLIKNKLSPTMSLQVMGNIEPAAKVVLWSETRQPIQTWAAPMRGLITSNTFPGMVLDVKGGKTYDKDHVVIMPESDERPSQQWHIELL